VQILCIKEKPRMMIMMMMMIIIIIIIAETIREFALRVCQTSNIFSAIRERGE
jgi:uncharacterized membrane protein YwzB